MGDLVDLDEYREQKRKEEEAKDSVRPDRFDEIMAWLEDFLERNPVETGPVHSTYDWLNPDYNPSVVKIITVKKSEEDDEPTD